MESIPIEKLADMVGSRYALAVGAAKRARQLKDGAVPLVKVNTSHPLTVALHEIAAGKVIVKALGETGDEPLTDGRKEDPVDDTLGDGDLFDADLFGIDPDEPLLADDVEDEEEDEDLEDDEDLEMDDDDSDILG